MRRRIPGRLYFIWKFPFGPYLSVFSVAHGVGRCSSSLQSRKTRQSNAQRSRRPPPSIPWASASKVRQFFYYFLSIRTCAWPHRYRCAQRYKSSFGPKTVKNGHFFLFFLRSRCAQRDKKFFFMSSNELKPVQKDIKTKMHQN